MMMKLLLGIIFLLLLPRLVATEARSRPFAHDGYYFKPTPHHSSYYYDYYFKPTPHHSSYGDYYFKHPPHYHDDYFHHSDDYFYDGYYHAGKKGVGKKKGDNNSKKGGNGRKGENYFYYDDYYVHHSDEYVYHPKPTSKPFGMMAGIQRPKPHRAHSTKTRHFATKPIARKSRRPKKNPPFPEPSSAPSAPFQVPTSSPTQQPVTSAPVAPPTQQLIVPSFRISPATVLAGVDELLFFTVEPENGVDTVSNPVQLFEESGTLLGNALDDGSPASGDDKASDNVFTNSFAFNFGTTGAVTFFARIGGDIEYSFNVTVVEETIPLSESSIAAMVQDRLQDDFLEKRGSGKDHEEALQELYSDLLNNLPTEIGAPDDIVLTLGDFPSLTWTTTAGLTEALIPDFASPEPLYWENIIFGDITAEFQEGRRRKRNLRHYDDADRTDPQESPQELDTPQDNDDREKRRTNSILECVSGLEISLFGLQSTNFLSEVAEAAGVPAGAIQTLTSAGGSLNVFKNLQAYTAVSFVSLSRVIVFKSGTSTITTIAMMTDVPISGSGSTYSSDLTAKRVVNINGYLAITPAFIQRYSSSMHKTSVYFGGAKTTSSNGFESAFNDKSVAAFFGHDNFWRPADPWVTLFNGGNAGNTPCVGSGLCDLASASSYNFLDLCNQVALPNLRVTYTWPLSQNDLDTGTDFLGQQVGFDCGQSSTPYTTFSGDDTTAGGMETNVIDLQGSLDAGEWVANEGVQVQLNAGWYEPAGGMGPATVTISLDDGSFSNGVQTINPGSQNSCSSTCVGQVTVFAFPRLQVRVSIGGSECNNPLMSAPTPAPLTSPNTCQQGFYDSINFNTNGVGETELGLLKTAQWSVVIFVLMYDILSDLNNEARTTAVAQYPGFNNPCHNNVCDAFRHSYFNYRLSIEMDELFLVNGITEAKAWGDAHEISSVNEFPERIMDLINNDVGRRLSEENPCPSANRNNPDPCAINVIRNAIDAGRMASSPVTSCS